MVDIWWKESKPIIFLQGRSSGLNQQSSKTGTEEEDVGGEERGQHTRGTRIRNGKSRKIWYGVLDLTPLNSQCLSDFIISRFPANSHWAEKKEKEGSRKMRDENKEEKVGCTCRSQWRIIPRCSFHSTQSRPQGYIQACLWDKGLKQRNKSVEGKERHEGIYTM